MPGRQSHGPAPSKRIKVRANSKKKTLDALAIASHQVPDTFKLKQHRLGANEGGNKPKKRTRETQNEDGDEEAESSAKKMRKGPQKGRFDELDIEKGSDSEGNEWKLGDVDSDDDSDLDSEEAFGESDEERFEGYALSGSSHKKKAQASRTSRNQDVNLNEEDEQDGSDSELEEGDLGEGAIDLADMLDATEGDGDIELDGGDVGSEVEEEYDDHEVTMQYGVLGSKEKNAAFNFHREEAGSDSEEESDESDDVSSNSSADDDEYSDPAKDSAAVQKVLEDLSQTEQLSRSSGQYRNNGVREYNTTSEAGLTSKIDINLEEKIRRKGAPKTLAVPLAKRQQDRFDRSAAYDKSKETLDRWTDTVKHNRRADHLMFPLPDADTASVHANNRLQPTGVGKPFNELEATIQSILEESGLATAEGKDDEDRIREFEELEANKLSLEEVKTRRDQLRMARELLFREEAKAKRIKKIKSKSYRRVHRKQREKEERLNKEALIEGGFVPSEDEEEAQDRRRAEERMGAKHRGSKWAKETKRTGRAAWDDDAREGITEMARKDEELRKRVEGRTIREGDFSSDSSSESDEGSEDDEDAVQRRTLRQLEKLNNAELVDESLPGAKLANMKFMQTAEAARKKENDAMVENIRREVAGEEALSEEEVTEIGRRIFGPGSNKILDKITPIPKRNEFEEPPSFDEEDENIELEVRGVDNGPIGETSKPQAKKTGGTRTLQLPSSRPQFESSSGGGAWSKAPANSDVISNAEAKRRRYNSNNAIDIGELDLSKAAVIAKEPKLRKKSRIKTTTIEAPSDDESDNDSAIRLPFAIRDQELIKRAFAGADVVGEFEAEKRQMVEDEDEKVIDNTLPGWGSWVGDGVSKKDKTRNKGRFLTKSEGVKEQNRKDAKLQRVIISEKHVKKNDKYLASNLPHPFETRQQYERSLRLPIGSEWATKETVQDSTKPKVLLKQGIIAPMSKPMI
ncbi:hypothetical protein B7494_g2093 [Chlorociboria aeruginascens]|nr:hypothetical protein B7494_g2093 [Chlorociboria aeruginascens]